MTLGKRCKCTSCGGEYYPDQSGGYYHLCPTGTDKPRNENVQDLRSGILRVEEAGRIEVEEPTIEEL